MSEAFFRSFAAACGVAFLMMTSTSFAGETDTTAKPNVRATEPQMQDGSNRKPDEAKPESDVRPKRKPVYIPEEVTRAKEAQPGR